MKSLLVEGLSPLVKGFRHWPARLLLAMAILGITGAKAAQTGPFSIGPETLMPIPQDAQWQVVLNTLPANGDTVTLNPPQFQWCWTTNASSSYVDTELKTYVFQACYDGTFNNQLAVNVRTCWNFYNMIAPFTQSTVYWRVGYIHGDIFTNGVISPSTNAVFYWGPTNQFTIAANAKAWDRSPLANPTYMAEKASHPYMLLNAQNAASIYQYLQNCYLSYSSGTTNRIIADTGRAFNNINITANAQISGSYWPTNIPSSVGGWASATMDVAFMWALTGQATWSNAHPELALNLMANNFITNANYGIDFISSSTALSEYRALAFGYDWCYNLLNATERSNILYAIGIHCNWELCNGQYGVGYAGFYTGPWRYGRPDPTGNYDNEIVMPAGSMTETGNSHGNDNVYLTMIGALAGCHESAWCSNFFDFGANYLLGPSYCYREQLGVGRAYTAVHIGDSRQEAIYPLLHTVFPEEGWTNNPYLTEIMDFEDRWEPVGMAEQHEPWGESGGTGEPDTWVGGSYLPLALMTGNGRFIAHWWNAEARWFAANHGPFLADADQITFPYYLYTNTQPLLPTTNLATVFTNQGWAIASTEPPNMPDAATNCSTVVFCARPNGGDYGHAYHSDGSFQFWFRGAPVTDSGGNGLHPYSSCSWAHYTCAINGLGQNQVSGVQIEPYYAGMISFTNNPNYTYMAADLTRAYCRKNLGSQGGAGIAPVQYMAMNNNGALWYLTNATRQILFARGRYLVIYDNLQCANAPTNSFEWVYPVFPNSLSVNPAQMSFQYSVSNWANGQNVSVYVQHVVNPNELNVTAMTGSDASNNYSVNPVTHENYWANPDGSFGDVPPLKTSVLWFSNKQPTNQFHFMTVIYPVSQGETPPTITSLDDNTVAINGSDGNNDVVTFEANPPATATFAINSLAINSAAGAPVVTDFTPPPGSQNITVGQANSVQNQPLAAPQNLHIVLPYSTSLVPPTYWAWWNPDTISGSPGAGVTSWADSSPAAKVASPWSAGTAPTLDTQNGHNVLLFNGLNNAMACSSAVSLPQPLEVFMTMQTSAPSNTAVALGNLFTSSYVQCANWARNHGFSVAASLPLANNTPISPAWVEVTFKLNGASSEVDVDGTPTITGDAGTNGLQGILIGAANNQSAWWNGHIGDILVYTNILDTNTQQTVENNLRNKYGF